jgi:hypothetical protein
MAVKVPLDHRKTLSEAISSGKLAAAVRIIQTIGGSDPDPLAKALVDELDWSKSFAKNFLNVLTSMIVTREQVSQPIDEFLEDVLEQISISSDSTENVKNELAELMEMPKVAAAARTSWVARQFERTFRRGNVISSLRAAFSDDEPVGFVMVHELQITFTTNGQRQTLTFGLNAEHLLDLSRTLERAIRHEAVLEERFSKLAEMSKDE